MRTVKDAIETIARMDGNAERMRTCRLMYVAQGLSLARDGERAFDTEFSSWPSGPVSEEALRMIGVRSVVKPGELGAKGLDGRGTECVALAIRQFPKDGTDNLASFCATSYPFLEARKDAPIHKKGKWINEDTMAKWFAFRFGVDPQSTPVSDEIISITGEEDKETDLAGTEPESVPVEEHVSDHAHEETSGHDEDIKEHVDEVKAAEKEKKKAAYEKKQTRPRKKTKAMLKAEKRERRKIRMEMKAAMKEEQSLDIEGEEAIDEEITSYGSAETAVSVSETKDAEEGLITLGDMLNDGELSAVREKPEEKTANPGEER